MKRVLFWLAASLCPFAADAEEGMWTYDNFPTEAVQRAYGWAPDQAFLDHVQSAAIRLSGCSASLVSSSGLVLTNWHCMNDCMQQISSEGSDYLADGFLALKPEDEKTCPGETAEILVSIADVTDRIRGAMAAVPADQAGAARDAETGKIESEQCEPGGPTRCEVVTLYQGGQYKLYRFLTYTDVRVVFYPENPTGDFGGEPDNFNFPRYALDAAFLRIYQDGKPLATPNHLTWRSTPPVDGEFTLVAGNPAQTDRLKTTAELAYQRDWYYPTRQLVRSELLGRLRGFETTDPAVARAQETLLLAVENSYKAEYGQMRALLEPAFFASLQAREDSFKGRVAGNDALKDSVGDAYGEIDRAVQAARELTMAHDFLAIRAGSVSQYYSWAVTLVRAAYERERPDGDRLDGYTDNSLAEIREQLEADIPTYQPLEKMAFSLWLSKAREYMHMDDPRLQRLLGGENPDALAARLASGTKIADPKLRLALFDGGKAAIDASDDPLIVFVRAHESDARDVLVAWRDRVDTPIALAQDRLAQARFALDGDKVYPDATFTPRLSYGRVQGWSQNDRDIAFRTTFGEKYARAGAPPFELTAKWIAAKDKVNPDTTLCFVTTNDFIGGNSGSPVIDRDGKIIGTGFDNNLPGLGSAFGYDGATYRTVTVSTAAISEALKTIYGDTRLQEELAQP